jgi:hypothetical protein
MPSDIPEMLHEEANSGNEYVVAEEDVIQPYELAQSRTLYFNSDSATDAESDLLMSAAVWLHENKDNFSVVVGIDFAYFGVEKGAALALTVE